MLIDVPDRTVVEYEAEHEARVAMLEERENRRTPIICHETGQEFADLDDAVQWLGSAVHAGGRAYNRATPSQLRNAAQRGIKRCGYHWRLPGCELVERIGTRARPVQCIETGERFPSCKLAARKHGNANSHGQAIYGACAGLNHTAYGLHWRFLTKSTEPRSEA